MLCVLVSVVIAKEKAADSQSRTTARAPPRCTACKNLMKGHKNVKDCPKNKK